MYEDEIDDRFDEESEIEARLEAQGGDMDDGFEPDDDMTEADADTPLGDMYEGE